MLAASLAPVQSSTVLVSSAPGGAPGDGFSEKPAISADGRYIAFTSSSSNLVPGVGEPTGLVFVRDVSTHTTSLGSAKADGTPADTGCYNPFLNSSGRFIVFNTGSALLPTDLNGLIPDVYLRDLVTGYVELISVATNQTQGNAQSIGPAITPDARFVVFSSLASTLVSGDTNGPGGNDIFLRDRQLQTTERVSVGSNGEQGNFLSTEPAISPDGRFVVFSSLASNFVLGDTNGQYDVFVRDRVAGTTTLASVRADGVQGDNHSGGVTFGVDRSQVISANGRFIAFRTYAQNLVAGDQNFTDILVKDLWTGTLMAASVNVAGQLGDGPSTAPRISADGRWVLFESAANNLVPNDTGPGDVFLRDMVAGTTERVSLTHLNQQANQWSMQPAMSADGRFIAFASPATNLVPNHSGSIDDIFLRTRALAQPQAYCAAAINSLGCAPPIDFAGTPSAAAGAGFTISASQVVNHKLGRLVYSTSGANESVFAGGLLCLHAPLRWTAVQSSGGNAGQVDCSGVYQFDFNAWIASGRDPALTAGEQVWAQWFIRDPAAPTTLNSSNALTFVIAP